MSFPRVDGYVVVSKIGSGSYSTVYKAYAKVGPRVTVAIKSVSKSRLKSTHGGADNLLTEIALLKTLRHPHIVHMRDFVWDDKNIYIVMEYCDGDLSMFIRRFGRLPELTVLYFLQQLASALRFLRDKGVAHMDLKPHNLLLSKTSDGKHTLKLADFGFARYMTPDSLERSVRGSPLYMAPEMLAAASYGPQVDMWSTGVIMYECLFGHAPYRSATLNELLDKIQRQQPIEFPPEVPVSPGCADLLTRLLQHDPARRITHEEFFQHQYLDLEHMPSPENYQKAVSMVQQAIAEDSLGRYSAALDLYRESLRYLAAVVGAESDPVRRHKLRDQLTQYLTRAEQLKAYLTGAAPPAPPPAPPRATPALAACCTGASNNTGLNDNQYRRSTACCARAQQSARDSVTSDACVNRDVTTDAAPADESGESRPSEAGSDMAAVGCEAATTESLAGKPKKMLGEPQDGCRVQ